MAANTQHVHGEERQVEEQERPEEVATSPCFAEHLAEHLGEPVIDTCKDAEERTTEEHVVNVRNDEVGVVNVDVNRCRCHEHARQTTDDEHRDESQGVEHCRRELDVTTPQRSEPVEHLDGRRNGNNDGRQHEGGAKERIHARLEHVVPPHDEAQEGNARNGEDHGLVSVDGLACERGHHIGDDTHQGQDHDVHGRVRVEPEEVLPEYGLTAAEVLLRGDQVVGQKEVRVQEVIHEEHGQSSCENRCAERDDDGCDEQSPHRQRHIEQLHALGTLVQNGRDVVDGTHDRREADQEE